jgi:N-dimethylarginine dimethylaminohydrolase
MKTIYMVDPDNFGVSYTINPWMNGNIGKVDAPLANQQWKSLFTILCQLGVDVRVFKSQPGLPDATFVANAGLLCHSLLLPSQFRYEERAAEEDMFAQAYVKDGCLVADNWLSGDRAVESFEGAGDALFSADRKVLWVGTGFRTTPGISRPLSRYVTSQIIELELVDPRFYHLDTCFCPLDTGVLLWYPAAFSRSSREKVAEVHTGGFIEVDAATALQFACNAVSVGNAVVLPLVDGHLVEDLQALGHQVFTADMSEFMKAGGACKCLTLENVRLL